MIADPPPPPPPKQQNSGLLNKYTSVTFNSLAFITIHVYLSSEKILAK